MKADEAEKKDDVVHPITIAEVTVRPVSWLNSGKKETKRLE
jgi:hypothetical protein